jgi:hypothetical protein
MSISTLPLLQWLIDFAFFLFKTNKLIYLSKKKEKSLAYCTNQIFELNIFIVSFLLNNFSRRDLHNYILRFYIHTPFWGLLLKYNVIRKL